MLLATALRRHYDHGFEPFRNHCGGSAGLRDHGCRPSPPVDDASPPLELQFLDDPSPKKCPFSIFEFIRAAHGREVVNLLVDGADVDGFSHEDETAKAESTVPTRKLTHKLPGDWFDPLYHKKTHQHNLQKPFSDQVSAFASMFCCFSRLFDVEHIDDAPTAELCAPDDLMSFPDGAHAEEETVLVRHVISPTLGPAVTSPDSGKEKDVLTHGADSTQRTNHITDGTKKCRRKICKAKSRVRSLTPIRDSETSTVEFLSKLGL